MPSLNMLNIFFKLDPFDLKCFAHLDTRYPNRYLQEINNLTSLIVQLVINVPIIVIKVDLMGSYT